MIKMIQNHLGRLYFEDGIAYWYNEKNKNLLGKYKNNNNFLLYIDYLSAYDGKIVKIWDLLDFKMILELELVYRPIKWLSPNYLFCQSKSDWVIITLFGEIIYSGIGEYHHYDLKDSLYILIGDDVKHLHEYSLKLKKVINTTYVTHSYLNQNGYFYCMLSEGINIIRKNKSICLGKGKPVISKRFITNFDSLWGMARIFDDITLSIKFIKCQNFINITSWRGGIYFLISKDGQTLLNNKAINENYDHYYPNRNTISIRRHPRIEKDIDRFALELELNDLIQAYSTLQEMDGYLRRLLSLEEYPEGEPLPMMVLRCFLQEDTETHLLQF